MMVEDKRIRIIIGHYGSGKTEFAVNYVMKLADTIEEVAIADLDVVNPYFRSREKHVMLEDKGIKVYSSSIGHSANLDLPAVAAAIMAPLQSQTQNVVLDVGGDSVGARALARFMPYFKEGLYDMFCVVNTNRPDTKNIEGVIHHITDIERVTGLKVTGLVNNTHFLRETQVEDVMKGQEIIETVSDQLNIPIKYVCILEKVAHLLPEEIQGDILPIKMYMREEWM